MAPLRWTIALCLFFVPGCLLLQEEPLRGAGESCENDDWCEDPLFCLKSFGSSPGKCYPVGACYDDTSCYFGYLCQGGDARADLVGACVINTGCKSDFECGAGLVCQRGVCYVPCTTSSDCGTDGIGIGFSCDLGECADPFSCRVCKDY